MAELKTKQTESSVEEFLKGITDKTIRQDCVKISELMERATGEPPKMWGSSIVGFGTRHLKYESGRELDFMEIGFAPRKQNLTLYLMDNSSLDENLLTKLGKHKLGKGCLYFKSLSDVDETILERLINDSVKNIRRK